MPPKNDQMQQCTKLSLKGNSHQIILSEMSQPGIEVHIEKLLLNILERLGKGKSPLKVNAKVPSYSASSVWRQFGYNLYTLRTSVKQKLETVVSAVRIPNYQSYVSEFLRQSGTQPSPA